MTLPELAARIDEMAAQMEGVASDMDWHHGDQPAIHEHSVELGGWHPRDGLKEFGNSFQNQYQVALLPCRY